MAKAKKAPEPEVLEHDGFPTAAGLVRQGLAHRRTDRNGRTYIQVTDAGHKALGDALRERGQYNRENGIHYGVSGRIH